MDQILYYSNIVMHYVNITCQAIKPCWAEFVGALLMAIMINLLSLRGSQKETLRLLSLAFFTIILKDIVVIGAQLSPEMGTEFEIPQQTIGSTELALISLTTSLLITAAFHNMRLYFSSAALVFILTILLSGISIALSIFEQYSGIGEYLTSVYMIVGLFTVALSFYISRSSRQNKTVRGIGHGFVVLTLGYGYMLDGLVDNVQQILLLCYTIAIVLAMAAQIQFLNMESEKLLYKLDLEEKGKRDIWQASPFPIIISRLRDDRILYMNPTARQMFLFGPHDIIEYPLSALFVSEEQRNDFSDLLHHSPLIRSFEAEVHHPEKDNNFWIDLMTRITDMDEEIVLFTTFKDVTDQRQAAKLLEEQAATDPLTGLYNRRQFEILAYQGLQAARRYGTDFSIAMLDIDFFKKVNDTYGHEAGDTVLKELSRTLRGTLRKSDIVARYGGEEFVIFLVNTKPEDSKIAVEHVREAVENMDIIVDGEIIHITISAGISDRQSTNLKTLIKHADEALYASKENGRNQTTLYQDLNLLDTQEGEKEAELDGDEAADTPAEENKSPKNKAETSKKA